MKVSALFNKIEKLQGRKPWGHVLDAGTGPRSLAWLSTLRTASLTAVTSQEVMAQSAPQALATPLRECDRILVGNWADGGLLPGERFDTVVLDYVVGAIDAFAPYFQEGFLSQMASRTHRTLYVTGLEPYVPIVVDDEVGQFVGDLGRLRDACTLLARERPYREYPAEWVSRRLQAAGMKVTDVTHFRIRSREQFLNSQLEICEVRASRFEDRALAARMVEHIEAMRRRGEALIVKHDGLPYGRDYVLKAQAPRR